MKGLRIVLIVLGILLLIVLIGPLIIPIPPLQGTRPPRELADPDSRFIEVNGLQVHYKAAGTGEPVLVLLHGFGASTFSWQKVMGPLSAYGTVIAFDRPAFGLTERPLAWTGANPYSTEFAVDLTVALLDQLGVDRAILVGHSAGGTVALATCLRHPERVEALVLVAPAVYEGGRPGGGLLSFLLKTPQLRRLGPLLVRSIQSWGEDVLQQSWHDPSRITAADRAGYRRPLQVDDWDRALWELTLAAQPLELSQHLDAVQVPVLIITGDDDRIVPTASSVRLAGEVPGSQLVVVPACGHLPQEETPDAFMQALSAFLARTRP